MPGKTITLKFRDTAPNVQELKTIFVLRVIAAGRRLRRGRRLVTNIQLDIVLQVHQEHERSLMNSFHNLMGLGHVAVRLLRTARK